MSIDYDRLRELLEQWRHGDEVRDQLEAQWEMELAAPDMARELLRLRDGIEVIRDGLNSLADLLARDTYYAQSGYVRDHAKALTDLLNGDTK